MPRTSATKTVTKTPKIRKSKKAESDDEDNVEAKPKIVNKKTSKKEETKEVKVEPQEQEDEHDVELEAEDATNNNAQHDDENEDEHEDEQKVTKNSIQPNKQEQTKWNDLEEDDLVDPEVQDDKNTFQQRNSNSNSNINRKANPKIMSVLHFDYNAIETNITSLKDASIEDLLKCAIVKSYRKGQQRLCGVLKQTLKATNAECDFPLTGSVRPSGQNTRQPNSRFGNHDRDSSFRPDNKFRNNDGDSFRPANKFRNDDQDSFRSDKFRNNHEQDSFQPSGRTITAGNPGTAGTTYGGSNFRNNRNKYNKNTRNNDLEDEY